MAVFRAGFQMRYKVPVSDSATGTPIPNCRSEAPLYWLSSGSQRIVYFSRRVRYRLYVLGIRVCIGEE